ncbi:MAG: tetratricopeptide repeat protein [Cyanobacteria bacterium P01_D01_bin.14]
MTPIIGGRYKIVAALGKGGFGQTFLAHDLHLPGEPQCVVKQLKPRRHDQRSLASARRLFDAEARALYDLGHHPQIPYLLAHFEEQEQFFLVQEFIEGQLLSQELADSAPMPETLVIGLLQEILSTLVFVHERQIVHRDIKPSNLIRRRLDQKIVLIDFGTVKQINAPLDEEEDSFSVSIAIGSLGYMPNEQLAGRPCLSSDIFAVGMLAIQALTGIEPKRLRQDLKTSEVVWQLGTEVSPELQRLITTMVRYDYRQRYASAKEALAALARIVTPSAIVVSTTHSDRVSTAWFERGERNFERAEYKEAVACYDAFLEAAPDDTMAWFKRGMALEHLEDLAGAIAAYDRVIQLQPDDYLAWMKRGKGLEALDRPQEALTAYEEVTHLQPDNYWVWYDQGQLLEQLDRPEDAISAYSRAIQLKPDFQAAKDRRKHLLKAQGHIDQLYHQQYYAETVEACDAIIERGEADALAWLMRGMALESLGQHAQAALSYGQVLKLQPKDHVTWFKLASLLERLQKPEKAAAAYAQVLKIQPTSHWALYQRGKMLECIGQPVEARESYQRILELKPNFTEAKAALHRVQSRME